MSAMARSSGGNNLESLFASEFEDSTLSSARDDGSTANIAAMIGCALILLLMVSA